MVMINSSKHAENMFCLEFDFQNHRIDQSVSEEERRMNRRFRVIDQYMIESMLTSRSKAAVMECPCSDSMKTTSHSVFLVKR